MRNEKGQFTSGRPDNKANIGEIRVRTRHKRNSEQRAFIKVAEPNTWVLYARFVWEQHNGPIPKGMSIHHKDGDKLNDLLDNLELLSKAQHLAVHRHEFADRSTAAFVAARKALRWSTKSEDKITGRHPANCNCPIHANR